MNQHTLTPICTAVALVLLWVSSIDGSTLVENPFIGISPQDENYYKIVTGTIKCKDGSGDFNRSKLNDDFCDCLDGTDEPGTSACPEGRFYCRNAGHSPLVIFSARVNDGICDCCDGSDEYNSQAKCPNTCWEAGKVARDKLEKKIATYKEGVALRKQEVEQAKLAIAKEEAELSKLKEEENILKGLVQQLMERKEQIEKLEEKERQQKENEEKERRESKEKANREEGKVEEEMKQEKDQVEEKAVNEDQSTESSNEDKISIMEGDPSEHVSMENDASENEELSKEELGRRVASRWTGKSEEKIEGADSESENNHGNEDSPASTYVEDDDDDSDGDEDDSYESENDDDTGKYEEVDDDIEETYDEDVHDDASSLYKPNSDDESGSSDNSSWLEKIQQTVQNLLRTVNFFQVPVNKSEADSVRKEYEETNKKLSEIQSRVSRLTKKLQRDFGIEKEFYSSYDRCFESKQNKYVYKICPFKRASQEDGHSTTRLGQWDKFEDSFRVMKFSNGDNCWNGPDRSLKVRLRCGLKIELTDVDEPSRCEYVALLSTPALCLEGKLKELENKLDLMNRGQQIHDEL